MAKLFISYHRTERELAERLRDSLSAHGHSVFIYTEMPPGVRWSDEVERELPQSDLVLVLLSKESVVRDYVVEEVVRAYEKGISLFPIRVRFKERLPYDLAGPLQRLQHASWSSSQDDARLVEQIQAHLKAKSAPRDSTPKGHVQQFGVIGEQYRQWLTEATSTLLIPGLGKKLPIEKAWIRLHAREPGDSTPQESLEQLLDPEWKHLRAEKTRDRFEAEYLIQLGRRIVVTGDPGSGKSTLLRWLAHYFSSKGQRVARVWLPAVVARQRSRGETFEEALPRVAGDGSGLEPAMLERVLSAPDFLLADGFDECDPHCAAVAEDLVRWGTGHPQTFVVVATRPISHDAGMFPEWKLVELLPLGWEEAPTYARQLLELLVSPKELEAELSRFQQALEKNWAGLLAARNPLLLGFLVQLFHHGEDIGQRRAGLYRAILDGAQVWAIPDKRLLTQAERGVARKALELAGWFLQQAPAQGTRTLEEKLGAALAPMLGVPVLQARTEAERALRYWEERRILERLRGGSEEFLTFVHAGLREYSAGCHLAGLPEAERQPVLRDIRRHPRWREVILLSAGAGAYEGLVRQLLEWDEPADPTSIEALAAAAALDEVDHAPAGLVQAVADRLVPRIESSIPLVAFEASELCLPLAPRFPDIFGSLAVPLCRSETSWTRLAAFRLLLASGPPYVDASQLRDFLGELLAQPDRVPAFLAILSGERGPGHYFEHDVVEEGLTFLIHNGAAPEVRRLLGGFIRNGRLSFHGVSRIKERLHQAAPQEEAPPVALPLEEQEELAQEELEGGIVLERGDAPGMLQPREGERALLAAVLRVTPGSEVHAATDAELRKLEGIATLISAMDWLEPLPRLDLAALEGASEPELLEVVLLGMIGVLGIDPELLHQEVRWLLSQWDDAAQREDSAFAGEWMAWLPRVPAEPQWEKARTLELPARPLVRALSHPSRRVSSSAAELLLHGAGGDGVPALLEQELRHLHEGLAEKIAYLAPAIWRTRAQEVLLPLLEGPLTRAVAPLYTSLPVLYREQPSERITQCLLRGIHCEDPPIAVRAAEALWNLGALLPRDVLPQLRAAAGYWEQKGSWCEEDRVSSPDEFCPRCRSRQFYPRGPLLQAIDQLGGLDTETRVRLLADASFGVADLALESLLRTPTPDVLRALLRTDRSSHRFMTALDAVLALDKVWLAGARHELMELLRDASPQIRLRMVRALGRASWMERDQALALARAALDDESLDVRNQAVLALRALQRIES